MAGPWLYCISGKAGKVFVHDSATLPVTIDTYTQLVKHGGFENDVWWYITRNWKNVAPGDELFVYTGDKDRGIIGYAVIQEVVNEEGNWYLRLTFDVPKSLILLEQPIPAQVVRRWIPRPQGNVLNLERFISDLNPHLPWS